ncbi:MAG: SDR family NAD(P)-dependent oxidoreductase [Pseudomonadota bacterium]
MRLENKVALITGGASGIGKACALRYAEEGADILIADLHEDKAQAAAEEVKGATGRRVEIIKVDVCHEEDIQATVEYAVSTFGKLDTVLAAAGVSSASYVSGEVRSQTDLSESSDANHLINKPLEDWNRVLQINLTGVMLTARSAARQMIIQGTGGTIVNIASTAALIPLPGAAEYCVSKAGVAMLTQVLAAELIPHEIRVNAIGPGFIETPMTAGMAATDDGVEMMLAMTPMGRLGVPREMANTALYLACDESSFHTGQTLYPNGGMTGCR